MNNHYWGYNTGFKLSTNLQKKLLNVYCSFIHLIVSELVILDYTDLELNIIPIYQCTRDK